MTSPHPLDRPVWSALTTRQRGLAEGDGLALRMKADYGPFAAAADDSQDALAALAALCPAGDSVGLVSPEPATVPPGLDEDSSAACWQMIAAAPEPPVMGFDFDDLDEADAAEMLALATLTKPGPFRRLTHRLGDFVGVRREGRLVAMAGERMQPEGFTEVSGVCTLPEFRGQGLAAGLMGIVAARIVERREVPFLHVYADNTGAIALYESLGYELRRPVVLTVVSRPAP